MLSLNKLEILLSSKSIIINKVFIIDNMCVYIEVICTTNGNMFLLYIPSKYEMKPDNRDDVYKISFIDEENNEKGDIIKEYGEEPDNLELEKSYNEVDIDIKIENKDTIVGVLEDNYKRPIKLQDMKHDKRDLQNINRQLNRLKFCTQNIKYKVGIKYKNYLSCIRKDDSISCFVIKNHTGKNNYKMMIIVDLETFYTNIESINLDVSTIQEGIYKILDKNHTSHTKCFSKLLQEEKDVVNVMESIFNKKKEYNNHIAKLEKMLENINKSEKSIFQQLSDTEEKYSKKEGLNNDIEKSHLITKYNTDLDKVITIKQEIIKTIIEIKLKKEDLFLYTDKFLFDQNVLIDTLFKNIGKITEYVK
jgi:hypothetical protein